MVPCSSCPFCETYLEDKCNTIWGYLRWCRSWISEPRLGLGDSCRVTFALEGGFCDSRRGSERRNGWWARLHRRIVVEKLCSGQDSSHWILMVKLASSQPRARRGHKRSWSSLLVSATNKLDSHHLILSGLDWIQKTSRSCCLKRLGYEVQWVGLELVVKRKDDWDDGIQWAVIFDGRFSNGWPRSDSLGGLGNRDRVRQVWAPLDYDSI